MSLECLKGLVGLSDIDCKCDQINDSPEDYDQSESGYYLTDIENGITFTEAQLATPNCWEGGSAWSLMEKALRKAEQEFCRDLNRLLYANYDQKLGQYAGSVGKEKYSTTCKVAAQYAGICVEPKSKTKGAVWCIESIDLGLNCDAEIELMVFSSENLADPLETITLLVTATTGVNQFSNTVLSEPLILPLQPKGYCENFRYYFVYQVPENCQPVNNELKCGCIGKKTGEEWKKFMNGHGFTTNDLTSFPNSTGEKKAFGLRINGFLQCNSLDWICDQKSNNKGGYSVLDVVAKAIQARAIMCLIPRLKESKKITFATLTGAEQWGKKFNQNNRIYQANVNWVADNLSMDAQDCFKCKSNKIGRRQSNLI